jgi:hypothetical protein
MVLEYCWMVLERWWTVLEDCWMMLGRYWMVLERCWVVLKTKSLWMKGSKTKNRTRTWRIQSCVVNGGEIGGQGEQW